MTQVEVAYRLPWRASTATAGAHRGPVGSGLGIFRDTVAFWRQPDPRRVDLRQTFRDPRHQLQVRRFEQRSAIMAFAVIDLSASMGFIGHGRKLDLAGDICSGVAAFARKVGDAFGLAGCDDRLREDFYLPASRRRGLVLEIERLFAGYEPEGRSARGLAEAASRIRARRALVLLISDFRIPLPETEDALHSLSRHDVVPIVLEDSRETDELPRWGLIELQDLETGRRRLTAMRPALRRTWIAEAEERRRMLHALFAHHGRRPFRVVDRLDPERLSEHLLGR